MEKPLTEEEEARQQLQRMIDRLDADQLAKLIELNNPARDPKTGEYILGYDQLGTDQRESFRRSVEQLLQAQTDEELARQAKEPPEEAVTQKICPKLPVSTVATCCGNSSHGSEDLRSEIWLRPRWRCSLGETGRGAL